MQEMVFRVRKVAGGWVVEDGRRVGGATDKESALDLARGMVSAINRHGGAARLICEEDDAEPSSA